METRTLMEATGETVITEGGEETAEMETRETTKMINANGYSSRWSLGSSLQPLSGDPLLYLEGDIHERLEVIETE